MIEIIGKSELNFDIENYGHAVYRISKVQQSANIDLFDTVVIPKSIFLDYIDTGLLKNDVVEECINALFEIGISQGEKIDFYLSFNKCCNVENTPIVTEITKATVKNAIVSLYKRWFDGKPYAYRIANKLSKDETALTIYIQKHVEKEFSIITRHPSTGNLADDQTCNKLVHWTLSNFSEKEKKLLKLIDDVLIFPQKIVLAYKDGNFFVRRFEDYPMKQDSYLSCLVEKHSSSILSDEDFLKAIDPDKLVFFKGYKIVNYDFSGKGLCLCPGVAMGVATFIDEFYTYKERESYWKEKDDGCIAFFKPLLNGAMCIVDGWKKRKISGVITTERGLISHSAVIYRGCRIPAVSVDDLHIDSFNRKVYINGHTINEGDKILIKDGEWCVNGTFEKCYTASAGDNMFEYIDKILAKCKKNGSFERMSVDNQLHFAKIVSALKRYKL